MSDLSEKVIDYFSARGCKFSGEVVGRGIYKFAIPGEEREDGRLTVSGPGKVKVWHMAAKAGLDLGHGWEKSDPVMLGGRQLSALSSDASSLAVGNGMAPVRRAGVPPECRVHVSRRPAERRVYGDQEMSAGVANLLSAEGWEHKFTKGGIEYWNDGTGATPACRVHVSEGIASVWSHRAEVNLPAPFRAGRTTKDGHKTMFITGRDLELESIGTAPRPVVVQQRQEQSINQTTVDFVRESWVAGRQSSISHPHLIKAGAQLDATLLKQFPDTAETRKRYCAADLLVPVFRPATQNGRLNLELVGGQRLMVKPWQGNDKLMLSGTSAGGAVVPIPPAPLMQSGSASLVDWMGALGRHRVESQPLVICEGVTTGMAIHQAGAGNVLCAVSSNNLPSIAKWVRDQGIDKYFPAGVVIAADLDSSRDASGKLKSTAIPKAIEAAEIVGGRVALAANGHPSGTDARDLLGAGGDELVREYIKQASLPADIRTRADVFPPHQVRNVPERGDLSIDR